MYAVRARPLKHIHHTRSTQKSGQSWFDLVCGGGGVGPYPNDTVRSCVLRVSCACVCVYRFFSKQQGGNNPSDIKRRFPARTYRPLLLYGFYSCQIIEQLHIKSSSIMLSSDVLKMLLHFSSFYHPAQHNLTPSVDFRYKCPTCRVNDLSKMSSTQIN